SRDQTRPRISRHARSSQGENMERTLRSNQVQSREQAEFASAYELEQQLESAERRYAEARSASNKARDEWRAVSAQPGGPAAAIQAAKARFDAVAARCARLHDLIDKLESRLDA